MLPPEDVPAVGLLEFEAGDDREKVEESEEKSKDCEGVMSVGHVIQEERRRTESSRKLRRFGQ